jgi:hypothetical protein
MAMSDDEINKLIGKLRNKYKEYSQKNSTWFNRDAFEERLIMALKNKMNLEGFILAEISNFEQIKNRYERKKNIKSFAEQVERIIDEQLFRIKKYPGIRFHPKAGVEISHLYGALSDFALHYFEVLFVLVSEKSLRDRVMQFESRLQNFAVPRGVLSSPRIEDHVAKLRRPGVEEIEIEKDKNDYLKESAFLLYGIAGFCEELLEMRDPEWENPLKTNKLFIEDQRKKRVIQIFSGLTGYGAIMKVQQQAHAIIDDFRLTAFQRQE